MELILVCNVLFVPGQLFNVLPRSGTTFYLKKLELDPHLPIRLDPNPDSHEAYADPKFLSTGTVGPHQLPGRILGNGRMADGPERRSLSARRPLGETAGATATWINPLLNRGGGGKPTRDGEALRRGSGHPNAPVHNRPHTGLLRGPIGPAEAGSKMASNGGQARKGNCFGNNMGEQAPGGGAGQQSRERICPSGKQAGQLAAEMGQQGAGPGLPTVKRGEKPNTAAPGQTKANSWKLFHRI
jgi:hypothetical protein